MNHTFNLTVELYNALKEAYVELRDAQTTAGLTEMLERIQKAIETYEQWPLLTAEVSYEGMLYVGTLFAVDEVAYQKEKRANMNLSEREE